MPDVDADGGLWYQWYLIHIQSEGYLYYINQFFSYPFGFDITFMPFRNLVYVSQAFIMQYIIGFNWNNLILLTNISSLITYPLSAIGAYLFCYYLTKNKAASFLAGIIFSFSFYHVHMARAQLSVNHIELIPFYFLSLVYFLDRKTVFSLLLSSATFALLFNTDAYYAFFSGLLSPLIFFAYKRESLISSLKSACIYYPVLLLVLIACNFNFFVTNFYLFNSEAAVATGRNSIAKNELLSILYYFSPPEYSMLKTYIPYIGNILYVIVPLIVFCGLVFLRRTSIQVAILCCFLGALILSAYSPYTYWINEIYFKYFGIFRGVARMVLLAYLFLGILFGLAIHGFMQSMYYRKLHQNYKVILFSILTLVLVGNSLNVDQSWWRLSNFSKEVQLYQSIKDNEDIHAIATYPMTQNDVVTGCPETYQLKAQIVHNKAFACGASPFDPYAQAHYAKISDITKSSTIDYLTDHNIDTIMIYNNLQNNSAQINAQLAKDNRLVFVGHLQGTPDSGYISTTDKARDINVYQIKKVVENNKVQKPLISISDKNAEITYEKVSPARYTVDVKHVSQKSQIIFDNPYSEKWEMYLGDTRNLHETQFFLNKDILKTHMRYNEYLNAWVIDVDKLKKEYPNQITINSDKSVSFTATIFFAPQAVFAFGDIISLFTFAVITLYFIIHLFYARYKK